MRCTFAFFGLPAAQHAVAVMALHPALEEARRHRQPDGLVLDRLEVHAREPARENVVADFRFQPSLDAGPSFLIGRRPQIGIGAHHHNRSPLPDVFPSSGTPARRLRAMRCREFSPTRSRWCGLIASQRPSRHLCRHHISRKTRPSRIREERRLRRSRWRSPMKADSHGPCACCGQSRRLTCIAICCRYDAGSECLRTAPSELFPS